MGDRERESRLQRTGLLLRAFLVEREEYRRLWRRFEQRESAELPNQSAVAQVIVHHLWETGDRSDTETSLARRLKDRIARALRGEVLSRETLDWFIAAFEMNQDDAARLRSTRFGDPRPEPGGQRDPQPVSGTLRAPQHLPVPQRHRTIAAFERRIIGPDRMPVAHCTTRAIVACDEQVSSFPYRAVPGAQNVRVLRGGQAGRWTEYAGSSPIMEITLASPLGRGQVASLEYEVTFASGLGPAVEYRRVAHARVDNLDLVVQFHPERLPVGVWWTIWDDFAGGGVLRQEPVELDPESCVHWFLPYLEDAAVGFRWCW